MSQLLQVLPITLQDTVVITLPAMNSPSSNNWVTILTGNVTEYDRETIAKFGREKVAKFGRNMLQSLAEICCKVWPRNVAKFGRKMLQSSAEKML